MSTLQWKEGPLSQAAPTPTGALFTSEMMIKDRFALSIQKYKSRLPEDRSRSPIAPLPIFFSPDSLGSLRKGAAPIYAGFA